MIDTNFNEAQIEDVQDLLEKYYLEIQGGFDDFYEDRMLEGMLYKIDVDGSTIGMFAMTKESQLTCYYLEPVYRKHYAAILDRILTFRHIKGIMAVTNDSQLMTEIMRRNFNIIKQAYNFIYHGELTVPSLNLRKANLADVPVLKKKFKDSFDNYEELIGKDSLYLGMVNDEVISLGNVNHHRTAPNTVSIGMVVDEAYRHKGYGTETIKAMINEGLRRGCRVHAGCWYYNHASKKVLEKAGMSMVNLIIRVDEL